MVYEKYHVNVSDGQKRRIKKSYADGKGVSIKFSRDDLNNGDDLIALTKSQVKKMRDALQRNKGVVIEMSPSQVKANIKMEDGFLSALLGLATRFLPTIAKTLLPGVAMGALSGAASAGVEKAIKGNGLFLKKGGCMCSVETDGEGLYLRKASMPPGIRGNGLYLNNGGSYQSVGKGFILGPNSPFKNIPILGAIL